MAVFGRKTARQRMRRATHQALSVPTFRTSTDCTPWVLGGLWPTDLQRVTPETAVLADYLQQGSATHRQHGQRTPAVPSLRPVSTSGSDSRRNPGSSTWHGHSLCNELNPQCANCARNHSDFNLNSSNLNPILAGRWNPKLGFNSHRPRPYDSRGLSPLPVGPSLRWRAKGLH